MEACVSVHRFSYSRILICHSESEKCVSVLDKNLETKTKGQRC